MRVKDQAKIDLIFKAALCLVRERGLAGITMNDIARAAAVATGTLYIYFKNKEELIRALFLECRVHSAKQYFAGLEEPDSYEDRMKKVFRNIIQYKLAFFEVSVFLEQSYHSPFVDVSDINEKQKALTPLLKLIREGIKKGILKKVSEELILSYLFGIIHEIVKKTYFSGKKLSAQTLEQLYTMFWDGVKAE